MSDLYSKKPKELICILLRNGWTQCAIGQATGIKQPVLSRIRTGLTPNPGYVGVDKLRNLVQQLGLFDRIN